MMRIPAIKNIFLLFALTSLLAGCSSSGDSAKDAIPAGKRMSILQLQKELTPNPALEQTPVQIPAPWVNQLWPQAGGYPTHAMGHLSLGQDIKKIWSASVGSGGGLRAPLTAEPVIADNTVFTLDARGRISAFDMLTGKERWQHSVVPEGKDASEGALGGGIGYASGMLYVAAGYRTLTALDTVAGKTVWQVDLPAPARSAPTIIDGRVYLITLDNRLMVYAASNGAPLWKYVGVSETTNLLGAASVAADQTHVILPLSSGEILGLNPVNGQVLWQDNLSAVRRDDPLASIPDIRGLPVIDQGVVFAASYSGRMIASSADNGHRMWQREIGSGTTPWPAGDSVFVLTTEQQLAAFARQSGETHWVTQLPRYEDKKHSKLIVWAGPVLAGGRLFVVGSNSQMDEVDPLSGKILRTHTLSDKAMLPPVVCNNMLFVLTEDGMITAYR